MNINEVIAKSKGWTWREHTIQEFDGSHLCGWFSPDCSLLPTGLPDYQGDQRLNMELLDEIKKTGFEFRLESDTTGSGEWIYTAVILEQRNDTNGTGWGLRVISTQFSLGTAICMAYIKLKGLGEG